MDTFLQENKEKKGINKAFILAFIAALALIAGALWLISLQPSMDQQKAQILQGSYAEGAPEFERITRDIVIQTDLDRTIQSPTAFGTITMAITGKIRNKGSETINGLEINVAVVTQFNEVLREKRVLVVPTQQTRLEPEETIPVTLTLDGFDKKDDRANIRWKVTAIRTGN